MISVWLVSIEGCSAFKYIGTMDEANLVCESVAHWKSSKGHLTWVRQPEEKDLRDKTLASKLPLVRCAHCNEEFHVSADFPKVLQCPECAKRSIVLSAQDGMSFTCREDLFLQVTFGSPSQKIQN